MVRLLSPNHVLQDNLFGKLLRCFCTTFLTIRDASVNVTSTARFLVDIWAITPATASDTLLAIIP